MANGHPQKIEHPRHACATLMVARSRLQLSRNALQLITCLLLGGLMPAFAAAAPTATALPTAVVQALQQTGIPPQAVSIVVQPLDAPVPLLQHEAGTPRNPASLMKLLTTLVALDTLGPAATWRTELLATVPVQDGIVQGDVILRGSGDPKFTYDRLWLLLRELRGRGVREIRGDLLLDRSAFAATTHDAEAFDGKPQRPYNVGADALLFNFATLHLTLIPENDSKTPRLIAEPLPAGFTLVNRLRLTTQKSCGDWREQLSAQFAPGQLTLTGDFPRVCGEKRWHLAGLPNAQLLHGVFTRLWRELGGEFAGGVREATTPASAAPASTVLLAASESPPLAEIVRDINKFSNNVMAQQLYLKVGAGSTAVAAAPAASPAAAEDTVRRWLQQQGLDFPELIIDNGSGLSRRNRIAAASLARLLDTAWRSAVMPEFIASLPIAASDGTTKKKYQGNGIAGQAHLKTGSLEGVRGIAGYARDRHGRRHIVVCMVNHANAAEAQAVFDQLLDWLWQGAAAG